jgi:hypothetical protein
VRCAQACRCAMRLSIGAGLVKRRCECFTARVLDLRQQLKQNQKETKKINSNNKAKTNKKNKNYKKKNETKIYLN